MAVKTVHLLDHLFRLSTMYSVINKKLFFVLKSRSAGENQLMSIVKSIRKLWMHVDARRELTQARAFPCT